MESRTYAATQNIPACTFFTGKIEASYSALEVGTEAPLDSENSVHGITEEGVKTTSALSGLNPLHRTTGGCGTKAKKTENEARDELVDGIVTEMSRRAAPFEELVSVPVPGGKLEPLAALALSQRWAKLLEDAEKSDPLPKPEDDAYRKYLIGLAKDASELEKSRRGDVTSAKAKQAIAQEDKDFNDAQAYLDKAAKAYKDAMEARPGEKEFRSPDGRMEEAVRLYATISRHKMEYEEAVLKKQSEKEHPVVAGTRSAAVGATADPAASGFNQIIGMCQDHVPELAQLIRDHPTELRFDKGLTLPEELKLRKECGADSKSILDAVKAQLTSKSARPNASAPPAPAAVDPSAATNSPTAKAVVPAPKPVVQPQARPAAQPAPKPAGQK